MKTEKQIQDRINYLENSITRQLADYNPKFSRDIIAIARIAISELKWCLK